MCIRDRCYIDDIVDGVMLTLEKPAAIGEAFNIGNPRSVCTVSYTHLRAHETVLDLVCRLLLDKKNERQQIK